MKTEEKNTLLQNEGQFPSGETKVNDAEGRRNKFDLTKNKTLLAAGVGSMLALVGLVIGGVSLAGSSTTHTSDSTGNTKMHQRMGSGSRVGFGSGARGEGKGGQRGSMQSGLGAFGLGGEMGEEGRGFGMQSEGIKAALAANDYNAFVTAWKADTHRPSDVSVPTQEEFAKMVKQYIKHQAEETAIKNNDYSAYVQSITPTKEEFATIVAEHQNREAMKTALESKDYSAFVKAWNADTKKPSNATVPTQEEFNQVVARRASSTQQ